MHFQITLMFILEVSMNFQVFKVGIGTQAEQYYYERMNKTQTQ